ncbi:MAG: hypothetical protein ABSB86_11005 [Bryobacteraceae bacterium]|jgi:hypothetical protein
MRLALSCAFVLLAACGGAKRPLVQDLSSHQDFSLFKLQGIEGKRDGDRLAARVLISDSSSMLTLDLHFAVGSPTVLQSGTWVWTRTGQLLQGSVTARSVIFLGGQDGPPSIGGSFDLMDASGTAQYRVTIPTTELKR